MEFLAQKFLGEIWRYISRLSEQFPSILLSCTCWMDTKKCWECFFFSKLSRNEKIWTRVILQRDFCAQLFHLISRRILHNFSISFFFFTCCLLLDSLFKGSVLWHCNRDSLSTQVFLHQEKKSWNMVQIWRQQEKKSWVCHDTDCTKASFISPKSLKTHKKMKKLLLVLIIDDKSYYSTIHGCLDPNCLSLRHV